MHYDIIIIGGGAAGLMAAVGAAGTAGKEGLDRKSVLVLEKMPRPGRKIVITGKGRCNFTNLKGWPEFSAHIRANSNLARPSFFNLTPQALIDFFESEGLPVDVERGDRAFPHSHKSMDVVDTLYNAAVRKGTVVKTGAEVAGIEFEEEYGEHIFAVNCTDGDRYTSSKLIIATGGLSYPNTGSTGDGLRFAREFGIALKPCFPSLTALVPKGYKLAEPSSATLVARALNSPAGHIDRSSELSLTGSSLCGIQLKNVGVTLLVNGCRAQELEGDIDFTDGGIEGPAGFSVSRSAVKAIINGGKVALLLNLKPGIDTAELTDRVNSLWKEVKSDSRSEGKTMKVLVKILLGKLMPWDLINGFLRCNPGIMTGKKGKEILKINALVEALTEWRFDIEGYVGYERCVVTAGGVSGDEIIPKTLETRRVPGLYICGELLDIDADTGGYNLHIAFSTGLLAGQSAAKSL
ncbi:MAG: NAD(P)/FAD-dependent oxidoreductase [Candidatus Cryptobacteroides sp.]